MTASLDQRTNAYDPFGEPMEVARACAETPVVGHDHETRHAAVAFWVLALLFVAGRVYLSDPVPSHPHSVGSASATIHLASTR